MRDRCRIFRIIGNFVRNCNWQRGHKFKRANLNWLLSCEYSHTKTQIEIFVFVVVGKVYANCFKPHPINFIAFIVDKIASSHHTFIRIDLFGRIDRVQHDLMFWLLLWSPTLNTWMVVFDRVWKKIDIFIEVNTAVFRSEPNQFRFYLFIWIW